MPRVTDHALIPDLKRELVDGRIDPREFLRYATLLGMSAGAADAFVGAVTGEREGTLDVDQRREIMAKLEAILQDDGSIVQPFWRSAFTFYDKRVQGFTMHPTLDIFANQLAISI